MFIFFVYVKKINTWVYFRFKHRLCVLPSRYDPWWDSISVRERFVLVSWGRSTISLPVTCESDLRHLQMKCFHDPSGPVPNLRSCPGSCLERNKSNSEIAVCDHICMHLILSSQLAWSGFYFQNGNHTRLRYGVSVLAPFPVVLMHIQLEGRMYPHSHHIRLFIAAFLIWEMKNLWFKWIRYERGVSSCEFWYLSDSFSLLLPCLSFDF